MMNTVGDIIDVAGRTFRIDGVFPSALTLTEMRHTCEGCESNEAYYDSPEDGTMRGVGGARFLCPRCTERAMAVIAVQRALDRFMEDDDEVRATMEVFVDADNAGRQFNVPYVDTVSAAVDAVQGASAEHVRDTLQPVFDAIVAHYAR